MGQCFPAKYRMLINEIISPPAISPHFRNTDEIPHHRDRVLLAFGHDPNGGPSNTPRLVERVSRVSVDDRNQRVTVHVPELDIVARWQFNGSPAKFEKRIIAAAMATRQPSMSKFRRTWNYADAKSVIANGIGPRGTSMLTNPKFWKLAAFSVPEGSYGEINETISPGQVRSELDNIARRPSYRHTEGWDDLVRELAPQISTLGFGRDAVAIPLPGNLVLKAWLRDAGSPYEHFVEFVEKYHGNGQEHLPVIYPPLILRRLRSNDRPQSNDQMEEDSALIGKSRLSRSSTFSFVVMERLEPVAAAKLLTDHLPEMLYLAQMGLLHHTMKDRLRNELVNHRKLRGMYVYLDHPIDRTMAEEIYSRIGRPSSGWMEVASAIKDELVRINNTVKVPVWNDLHHGNMMIRPSDGRLVITDPYT